MPLPFMVAAFFMHFMRIAKENNLKKRIWNKFECQIDWQISNQISLEIHYQILNQILNLVFNLSWDQIYIESKN
jgi:hypothetical protein